MREIVLDTESTGLDPGSGHRVVEIGCIELVNHLPTGNHYHVYINPERDMPKEAYAIHGLSGEFLKQHPVFSKIVDDFLLFIDTSPLIIHNAAFDMKFLDFELKLIEKPLLSREKVIDTLAMARAKFPGSPASLDALCRRFNVDLSEREKHGALLDATLLAEVYLELIGGRQTFLAFDAGSKQTEKDIMQSAKKVIPARAHEPSEDERQAHALLIQQLKNPLWNV